jgi:hypothetical protein
VSEIASGVRVATALFALAGGVFAARALLQAPRFEKIFEDMLGPEARLPIATRLVLDHHLGFLVVAGVLCLIPLHVAVRARSLFAVLVVGSVCTLLQVALGLGVSASLMSPMTQIIHELSA